MLTAYYSVLHFLVDGACAIAMYGWFSSGSQGYLNILLYNFCAFALQMPLGAALDLLTERRTGNGRRSVKYPYLYAGVGVALTLLGVLTHPVVLGLGNALFHVGGGVDVIRHDRNHGRKGRELGVFVAPGALGLFLGGLIADGVAGTQRVVLAVVAGVTLVLLMLLWTRVNTMGRRDCGRTSDKELAESQGAVQPISGMKLLTLACFLVVILRSYVGMAVNFSWKSGVALSLISVLAVVLGKMAGGFLAARLGKRRVIVGSLLAAALCYCLSDHAVFGITALFFFNMTMPITLHLLVEWMERLPGFSFGLLTFGLFLGFLPVYLEMKLPVSGGWIGVLGSLLSLVVLLMAIHGVRREEGDG